MGEAVFILIALAIAAFGLMHLFDFGFDFYFNLIFNEEGKFKLFWVCFAICIILFFIIKSRSKNGDELKWKPKKKTETIESEIEEP